MDNTSELDETAIAEILLTHFSPTGDQCEYMTTKEVAEIFDSHTGAAANVDEVRKALQSADFHIKMISKKLYWAIYPRL